MTVMARSGERFSGEALRHALESADLHHGDMNIFHRHELPGDRHSATLFSAANVLAPGDFEPASMDTLSSPGIAMFMRLPGPESPADTFQQPIVFSIGYQRIIERVIAVVVVVDIVAQLCRALRDGPWRGHLMP